MRLTKYIKVTKKSIKTLNCKFKTNHEMIFEIKSTTMMSRVLTIDNKQPHVMCVVSFLNSQRDRVHRFICYREIVYIGLSVTKRSCTYLYLLNSKFLQSHTCLFTKFRPDNLDSMADTWVKIKQCVHLATQTYQHLIYHGDKRHVPLNSFLFVLLRLLFWDLEKLYASNGTLTYETVWGRRIFIMCTCIWGPAKIQ